MNECIDSIMGHIHVCLPCCFLVTIRGLVGSFNFLLDARGFWARMTLDETVVGAATVLGALSNVIEQPTHLESKLSKVGGEHAN